MECKLAIIKWIWRWSNHVNLKFKLETYKNHQYRCPVIDYDWLGKDWIFLRDNQIIINCDDVNKISCKASETNSEVGKFGGRRVSEEGFYNITKEQLKNICDAKKVEVRVCGSST